MSYNAPLANYDDLLALMKSGTATASSLNTHIAAMNTEDSTLLLSTVATANFGHVSEEQADYPAVWVRMLGANIPQQTGGIKTDQQAQVILAAVSTEPGDLARKMQGYQAAIVRTLLGAQDDHDLSFEWVLRRLLSDPSPVQGVVDAVWAQRVGVEVTLSRIESR